MLLKPSARLAGRGRNLTRRSAVAMFEHAELDARKTAVCTLVAGSSGSARSAALRGTACTDRVAFWSHRGAARAACSEGAFAVLPAAVFRCSFFGHTRTCAVFSAVIVMGGCEHPTPVVIRDVTIATDDNLREVSSSPVDGIDVASSNAIDAGLRVPDTAPALGRAVALRGMTPLRAEARRDAALVGYLRTGALVDLIEGPLGREGCAFLRDVPAYAGWYRVRGDGFLCVGGTHAVMAPARDVRTPTQPMLDASMPYRYAISYGRSNMYRRFPTAADLRQFEPWRFRVATDPDAATPSVDVTVAAPTPRDAGHPRLEELEGDPTTPVIRRMLSGMYVAIDRSVRDAARGDRYWLTQSGGLVRDDRMSLIDEPPTFQGTPLGEGRALPMAWMVSEFGARYVVSPQGRVTRASRAPRLTAIQLADAAPITFAGRLFYPTIEGGAVLATNVRRAALRTPPEGVAADEHWIDVDLDEQVLVAYEGVRPVYATLVSSGRRVGRNAPERFDTPAGSFRIQSKHITTTMDGDTRTDGAYSIEDVPWVMYFEGSYALHAAFWHQYFGWRMSHGCVNLSPHDARWVFFWARPTLPDGWHGVNAAPERPGTRVELRHSRANQNVEQERPAGARDAASP